MRVLWRYRGVDDSCALLLLVGDCSKAPGGERVAAGLKLYATPLSRPWLLECVYGRGALALLLGCGSDVWYLLRVHPGLKAAYEGLKAATPSLRVVWRGGDWVVRLRTSGGALFVLGSRGGVEWAAAEAQREAGSGEAGVYRVSHAGEGPVLPLASLLERGGRLVWVPPPAQVLARDYAGWARSQRRWAR